MPSRPGTLSWMKNTTAWFRKAELASGFRPYLIFLILQAIFSLAILVWFERVAALVDFVIHAFYVTGGAFVILYVIKAFQDPTFCRSERHVEEVRRIELMEQKGDVGPVVIDQAKPDLISNPEQKRLSDERAP